MNNKIKNMAATGNVMIRKYALGRVAVIALLLGLLAAGPAQADFKFDQVAVNLDQPPRLHMVLDTNPSSPTFFQMIQVPVTNPDGTFVDPEFTRQAGGHPDFSLYFKVRPGADGEPAEGVHDVLLDLPQGFVGNPTGIPTCQPSQLVSPDISRSGADCPANSQIGVVEIRTWAGAGGPGDTTVGIYNIAHGPDVAARFGFNYVKVLGLITARVRPGDYGITSGALSISQAEAIESVRVKLWGVPSDPSHDTLRQHPPSIQINTSQFNTPQAKSEASSAPPVPFLTAPRSCTDKPLSFTIRGDSWENQGKFDSVTVNTDEDGTPLIMEGCERVPFKPSASARPLAHSADAPTGLAVDVNVEQPEDPYGIGPADVRKVKMAFPDGVSVSPSSAAGLGACSPAQIGLGTNDAPTCPASATIGKVTIDTPLLDNPLTGDVVLATQNDNPFNTLVALYIAAKGPGFYLKLPGKIDLDQKTGQMTATFDNTPQLPFSHMQVQFNGGSLAALATPASCGTYNTRVEITSWNDPAPVVSDSPMTINENCTPKAFAPSFSAGVKNPAAGAHSAFTMSLTRSDGMPYLQNLGMKLPKGLLADLASVPQCAAGPANAGSCPAASRIGGVSVLSGPGAQPLPLAGNVYFTGPYKDAPFGLAIDVPTAGQAGPFDLGTITVRAGLYVDRATAQASVKSDPFPTIIQGIPIRMRQVTVNIDRPNFMINPTSCAKQTVFASIGALGGAVSDQTAPFQVVGCGDLALKPKMSLKVTGKTATKDGTYPGVEATLTDPGTGANYDKVEAKLPLALVLEPEHAQALCKPEQAAAFNCPKTSIIGTASAKSVLPHELSGPVYFVEGRRKQGNRTVKTLPDLWIPLFGDGVTIDVRAKSQVDPTTDRLITTFQNLPDAPIKTFKLKINGGKRGILVVSGKSTCSRDMTFDLRYTGQNNETKVATSKPSVAGCKPSVNSTKTTKKSVTVKVGNVGAGKLTVSGGGLLARASKTLNAGPEASVTAKLTSKGQAALRRHGKVSVKVSVVYRPKVGKTVKMSKKVTFRT
jgi:hypothetical protein